MQIRNTNRIQGAIVVARVSSEEQVENTSLDGQVEIGCHKAHQLGLDVIQVFREEGRSGAYLSIRKEIQQAISLIEEGKASHFITMNMTRFARDVSVSNEIKQAVQRAGGILVFTDFEYQNTPTGNLQFNLMSAVSQNERDMIIDRTTKGRRRMAESGNQPSRNMPPYGYRVIQKLDVMIGKFPKEQLGQYVVVEEQAIWVREIFARYAGGVSTREVCRYLEGQGVPTPRNGEYWRPSTLKRILDNPTYRGMAPFARHENVYDERRIAQGMKLTFKRVRPEDEWIYIPCPPLVDPDMWYACQERLKTGRATYGGNPQHKHLLTGLLRCPKCARGMSGTRRNRISRGTPKHEHHYHCPDNRPSRNTGGVVCNKKHYKADIADAVVLRSICDVIREPGLLTAAFAAYRRVQSTNYSQLEHNQTLVEIKALDGKESATIEAQIEAKIQGLNTLVYVTKLKELDAKRRLLQARLVELDSHRNEAMGAESTNEATMMLKAISEVETALKSPLLTDGEKHDLLARVIVQIAIEDDGKYCVELKPFLASTVATVRIL